MNLRKSFQLISLCFLLASSGCGKKKGSSDGGECSGSGCTEQTEKVGDKGPEPQPAGQGENGGGKGVVVEQVTPAPEELVPGGGVIGLPPGLPVSGSVFNIPIGVPTVKINVGGFWAFKLPPRYHIIATASNKTFEGPSTIEHAQVMDDFFTRSPYCAANSHENGRIMTIPDGLGNPWTYCLRYFNTEAEFRVEAGRDRGINSLEFSSPGADPATYERFYFAARRVGDPDFNDGGLGTPPLARFNSFCQAAYNRGEVTMSIINNWTNDPFDTRPARVLWCNTNMSGIGAGFDVWVAGFLYESTNGASNNAAQAQIEMTYVATASGLSGNINPLAFLGGTALRVRTMLYQTGLNAPFASFLTN